MQNVREWIAQIGPWSLDHGPRIAIILGGAYLVHYLAKRFIEKIVRVTVTIDRHQTEAAEKKREETLITIFIWTERVALVLMVIMLLMHEIGIPIGPMLAGAGILGLAVGFGGQYLIRDFFTGFFMILENQYRIGDYISLDQTSGLVESISLRMTTLRDTDGTVHHVPHGDIKRVANYSKDFARINLDLRIGYHTNLEKVIEVVNRTGHELATDPQWKEAIIKEPAFLRVDDFLESGIVIKILGETLPLRQWEVTGEFRKRIKVAFDKEGIEIPLPQRVVHQYSYGGD